MVVDLAEAEVAVEEATEEVAKVNKNGSLLLRLAVLSKKDSSRA